MRDLRGGEPSVIQSRGLCVVRAYCCLAVNSRAALLNGAVALNFVPYDVAVRRADVVFVLRRADLKLNLIDHAAVFVIEVNFELPHLAAGDPRVTESRVNGGVASDVSLRACGGAVCGYAGEGLAVCNEIELVYAKRRKLLKAVAAVGCNDLPYECGLADGDAVFVGELYRVAVGV